MPEDSSNHLYKLHPHLHQNGTYCLIFILHMRQDGFNQYQCCISAWHSWVWFEPKARILKQTEAKVRVEHSISSSRLYQLTSMETSRVPQCQALKGHGNKLATSCVYLAICPQMQICTSVTHLHVHPSVQKVAKEQSEKLHCLLTHTHTHTLWTTFYRLGSHSNSSQ